MPCLKDWFPPVDAMETVSVMRLQDGETFEKQIPASYIFHLGWMLQEALPSGEQSQREIGRSHWLRRVLDRFAEEIINAEDMSDWRSKALTPVLVRALHKVDDFQTAEISKCAMEKTTVGGELGTEQWIGFYFAYDVVNPDHREWWLSVKDFRVGSNIGDQAPDLPDAEHSTGNVSWNKPYRILL